jgi:hypothetical protein
MRALPVTVIAMITFVTALARAGDDQDDFSAEHPLSAAEHHFSSEHDGVPESARPTEEQPLAELIGNADVIAMVQGGLSDSTVLAAIEVNPARFDVSPRALIALSQAGVSAAVIEAMIATEGANRRAISGAAAPPGGDGAEAAGAASPSLSPEALERLTQMAEQLAAPPEPPPAPVASPPPVAHPLPADNGSRVPRAWIVSNGSRVPFLPSTAQVAFMDSRGGAGALNTLQGIGERALAFASPALGLASGLGALFRSGDPTVTVVWALPGTSSSRELPAGAVIEFDFAGIPGVNPDQYQPALVRLITTTDNYRLVGAARTRASSAGGMPTGAIIEEPVPLARELLARGRYRVALDTTLPAGEYALVLRPVQVRERERRRNSENSLGDLLGGQSSDIHYAAWDFDVGSHADR